MPLVFARWAISSPTSFAAATLPPVFILARNSAARLSTAHSVLPSASSMICA
jgi:hypothetical protein